MSLMRVRHATCGVYQTERALNALRSGGSFAANGFMKPEGVVIFYTAASVLFKVTLEKDEAPKGKAAP